MTYNCHSVRTVFIIFISLLWHTIVTVSVLSSLSSSVYYDIQVSQCPYCLHYLHQFIMTYNCHSVRTVFIIFISLLWHTIVTVSVLSSLSSSVVCIRYCVMERKLKQGWSTLPPISIVQTSISDLRRVWRYQREVIRIRIWRRTDNPMAKRKSTKRRTTIYKTYM